MKDNETNSRHACLGWEHLTNVRRLILIFFYIVRLNTKVAVNTSGCSARPARPRSSSRTGTDTTRENARRELSTANTAKWHSTLKRLRWEMRGIVGVEAVFWCLVCKLDNIRALWKHFQAHDEICLKFPLQCKDCGKKKIPREKVRAVLCSGFKPLVEAFNV